jgi:putative tricarboxylic transport membrane protein
MEMLIVAGKALVSIFAWPYFGYMLIGALIGTVVGFIPGIGGYFALALMIPFAIRMDPLGAVVFILSMNAVITTGGSVTAVLFGVPGSGQNIAAVFDGYPMAQKGRGAEAVGAAVLGSGFGGLVGGFTLLLLIPVVRPIVMAFGSGEFLMMVVWGISCVVILASDSYMKGFIMAFIGFMLSFIGGDPVTGIIRFNFGTLYLWDGIPLAPLTMGKVALAMMVVMAMKGGTVAPSRGKTEPLDYKQLWYGGMSCFRHFWLFIRASIIGIVVGIMPGLGGEAAALVAYAHAKQCSKTPELFGTGVVEGIMAPEAANNSKDGGTLIPTLAFGVPGSGLMAVFMGILITMGIVPGQKMLQEFLPLTVAMAWTVVISNILGVVFMLALFKPLMKGLSLPIAAAVPFIVSLIFVGSFSSNYEIGDMLVTMGAGSLGYFAWRKQHYPIGPFLLGFVLGILTERNFRITMATYGWSFVSRPISIILFILFLLTILYPLYGYYKKKYKDPNYSPPKKARLPGRSRIEAIIVSSAIALFSATILIECLMFIKNPQAKQFPTLMAAPCLILSLIQLFKEIMDKSEVDVVAKQSWREIGMFLWFGIFTALIVLVSFIVAVPIFVYSVITFYFKETQKLAIITAALATAFIYVTFFWGLQMIELGRGVLVSFY